MTRCSECDEEIARPNMKYHGEKLSDIGICAGCLYFKTRRPDHYVPDVDERVHGGDA